LFVTNFCLYDLSDLVTYQRQHNNVPADVVVGGIENALGRSKE